MTKKQEADAAYRRQEVQRALASVLRVAEAQVESDPEAWTSLASDCALVRAECLTVTIERPKDSLPGQLDIDGTMVGEGPVVTPESDIPDTCPMCHAAMLRKFGGLWTPLASSGAIQCGACAWVLRVPPETIEAVRQLRRDTIGKAEAAKPLVSKRGKKTRGAG